MYAKIGIALLTGLLFGLMEGRMKAQTDRMPRPYKVPAQMPDAAEPLAPSQVKVGGYLGGRVGSNKQDRLLQVDLKPLLEGYRKRPGSHPWIGEHIGKWMHAATLAWANTGDEALKAKIDGAARDLIKTQEPDGYLGTYTPDKRFGLFPGADWDVWSHKYNLIGLLTYYHYTGNADALACCRKMGDLLIATFGPDKKSILSAGTHVGMAATSVLEPVVLLYRETGDARYLDFAKYIVAAWDEPNGPKVLTTLTNLKKVNQTANGKAYEMMSNLVGLCELARATGDRKYLVPVLNAWDDVVANQLYITGTASYGEHFHADHDLPNQPGANVGETCVTVTWIQLTSQLLRLTGEAKYGNELERSYYNHLAAAQRPDGKEWCYYTALEGTKPYGPGINCCVSSGPRGMALLPTVAYFKTQSGGKDVLAVNLFNSQKATLTLGGQAVKVEQETYILGTPFATALYLSMDQPSTFGFKIRAPAWADSMTVKVGEKRGTDAATRQISEVQGTRDAEGWIVIPPRAWKNKNWVTITFKFGPRLVKGDHTNAGRSALTWGPFVLAYENAKNPGLPPAPALVFSEPTGTEQIDSPVPFTFAVEARVQTGPGAQPQKAVFAPFAEVGTDGSRYRIWLGAPGTESPARLSLLFEGRESRSQEGNVPGSIADGDSSSFVVTYDGKPHTEDWFAVTLEKPAVIGRVVYAHGNTFHDGGWYDASAGKPRIEVQRTAGGPWESVGVLEDYPATTATNARGLRTGRSFTLVLKEPVTGVAVRVIGKPAHGDRPEQSFASCAELQAFAK